MRAARATGSLFLLALAGCSPGCDRGPAASVDAGAATDAASDRGLNDASDAPETVDVAEDIGPPVVDDGGWATPAWLPPYSRVRFATDPGRMITPPGWVPCRDGRVGCRELQREDCQSPSVYLLPFSSQMNHGRRLWFGFVRSEYDATIGAIARTTAVAELDGPVVTAWRNREDIARLPDGNANALVMDDVPTTFIRFKSAPNLELRDRLAILRGAPPVAPGRPVGLRILDDARELHGASERYFDVSARTAGLSDEHAVGYVPLGSELPVRVMREPLQAFAFRTVHVEDDAMFWEANIAEGDRLRSEQWVVRGTEAPHRLLDSGPYDLGAFDTDGHVMAWIVGLETHSNPSYFARSELWVAPYTLDPAQLQARRLLAFGHSDYGGAHAMQNGFYATGGGLGPFYVVNLRDGTYWEFDSQPGGMRLRAPTFISDTEVGFEAYLPTVDCATTVRLRLDSLGPRHASQGADAGS